MPGGDDNKTRRSAVQGCPEVLTKAGEGGEEGPPEAHLPPYSHHTTRKEGNIGDSPAVSHRKFS